ncbi:MAG: type II toxin-antitoxin system HipA family toxin [Pseudomonadota bacterium]
MKTGLALSPFYLPNKPSVFIEKERVFAGLYGLFNDSLPDGWGVLLMDRAFRQLGIKTITPLERLSYMGERTMGALTYHPAKFQQSDNLSALQLSVLAENAQQVLSGTDEDIFPELQLLGGSSGGAKPKVIVGLNEANHIISGFSELPSGYEHYLVKFSQNKDLEDAGAIEYIYSLMAKPAGIDLPKTRLIQLENNQRYFAIKRFDREGNQRIHTHTLGGLIHADHRIPSCDYDTYLQVTQVLTKQQPAIKQAFRRMLFNIIAHNRDDHVKNFSFMFDKQAQWQLAPAYDLMPTTGEHAMSINGEGKHPQLKDLKVLAEKYNVCHLSEMIEQVKDAVSQWSNLAKQYDIKPRIIQEIQKNYLNGKLS